MRGRSREASKRAELDKVEAALQGERERLAETEAALEHAIEQRDVIEDRRAFDENDDRIAELRKDVAWRRRVVARCKAEVAEATRSLGLAWFEDIRATRDDPRQRARLKFDLWLWCELRRDAIDFLRSWRGRHGQKAVVDERLVVGGTGREGLDNGDSGLDRSGGVAAFDYALDGAARALPDRWTCVQRDRRADRPERGLNREHRSAAA